MNCPKREEEEKRGSYLWAPILSAGTRGVGRSFDKVEPHGAGHTSSRGEREWIIMLRFPKISK